jgi:hypothetical protein
VNAIPAETAFSNASSVMMFRARVSNRIASAMLPAKAAALVSNRILEHVVIRTDNVARSRYKFPALVWPGFTEGLSLGRRDAALPNRNLQEPS